MSDVLPWLEYRWNFDFPVGMYRAILERLRGAPARMEELLRKAPPEALARQPAGKWSALEHAGHLWVLDELHHHRVEQYLGGDHVLDAADMTNRKTEEGNFNQMPVEHVLAGFRLAREAMVRLLEPLTPEDAARVATHPRLKLPMRLVDMCYFVGEHDDHHLAAARAAML